MDSAKTILVGARVTPDFAQAFRVAAALDGESMSSALRLAMQAYIDHAVLDPQEPSARA